MPDEKAAFDVFLSHNSKDKPAVRQIAEALERLGVHPWLDERELPPGSLWQDEIENIIEIVPVAAVLVGKDGLGPWEIPEMRACLSEMVDRGLRVIPVLLPGASQVPKLPLFLKQATWLDLRNGITEDGLKRLRWGITREKTGKEDAGVRQRAPRLHNLPFSSLGDLLKGRDEELRKLQDGAATAITQPKTIYGLGGIGKTRLAVEYAWRSGNLYDYAFFVVADSPEALRYGLANLTHPDLLNLAESKAAPQEETVAAVLRWFREHEHWLLILDNVDTKEAQQAVAKMVPSLSVGRVLITSRIRNWPAGILRQQIETLSLDEAQRFILQRTAEDRNPSEYDQGQALRLAEELGGLPLALEQAAAYISQRQMSLLEYLEEWEKEREKVLNWYDSSVTQYPASMAMTWQKTFRQLSPMAATILRLTAYLAPDPIPSKMFEEGAEIASAAVGLLCEETGSQVEELSIRDAIAELASYSMVSRKAESFIVHRMIQDALRCAIPEGKRKDWVQRTLQLVNQFAPRDPSDVQGWSIWDLIRPHTENIIKNAGRYAIVDPTTRLMNDLGLFLQDKALFREAEPLFRRALKLDEASLGPRHAVVASRLSNLAVLLKETNRWKEAETLMRRALQITEDSLGQSHRFVAIQLNNLADLLRETNRSAEAEPLLRRALQIHEELFGPLHPMVAISLSHLAILLGSTGRLVEAESLVRRALQIDEEFFGSKHPKISTRLFNLARIVERNGRLAEAEALMWRALHIDEEFLGPRHPNVAIDLSSLASLLGVTGRRAEAKQLFWRALEINNSCLGPDHPRTIGIETALGILEIEAKTALPLNPKEEQK